MEIWKVRPVIRREFFTKTAVEGTRTSVALYWKLVINVPVGLISHTVIRVRPDLVGGVGVTMIPPGFTTPVGVGFGLGVRTAVAELPATQRFPAVSSAAAVATASHGLGMGRSQICAPVSGLMAMTSPCVGPVVGSDVPTR